jgi:hypothetical protein
MRYGRRVMSAERGRQKPRAEMSAAMLEHIEERGTLKGFPAPRGEKLTLMKVTTAEGVIVWNKTADNMS